MSLVGWTTGFIAAGVAIEAVVSAGHEYLTNLEETENKIVTTTELQDALTTSFGMMSASILEQTGLWDAYRESLIMASNALDVVAGKEAIVRQAKAESMAMEAEYQEMLDENAKWKEAESKKELARIKTEDDANVRHQKLISDLEEKARAEREISNKQKLDAYELELKVSDEWVDAVNAETNAQIEATQAVDNSTESIDDNTDSKKENTKAAKAATKANEQFQSSAEMISGAEAYAKYATGTSFVKATDRPTSTSTDRVLREIAQSTRDTNNALRGY